MKGGFDEFAKAIRERESSNRYDIENKFGYLGAYQFGKARLLDLGISIDGYGKDTHPERYKKAMKVSKEKFLNTPHMQDGAFFRHCQNLKRIILMRYRHLIGKEVRGIKLTLSGMIAGIHLVGLGGFLKWVSGKDVKDGFGTKLEEYLTKFGDYAI
jgi:hypothetical protein